MKSIDIAKKSLTDAITILKGTVGEQDIKFTAAEKEDCKLLFSDHSISLKISWEKEDDTLSIDKPLFINSSKLLIFLKSSSTDLIKITESKKKHTLKNDVSSLAVPLRTINMDSWPNEEDKLTTIVEDGLAFSIIAKKLSPFVASSQYGGLLNIHIYTKDEELVLDATDAHRIGRVKLKDTAVTELGSIDLVVSNTVLSAMERLSKASAPIQLGKENNGFRFTTVQGALTIDCKMPRLDVTRPDLDMLIDKKPDFEWELDLTELAKYCKLHKNISNAKGKRALGIINITNNKMTIYAEDDPDTMSKFTSITAVHEEEKDISIPFTLQYLIDAIELIGLSMSADAKLGLVEETNMLWLQAKDLKEGFEAIALLAPVTV